MVDGGARTDSPLVLVTAEVIERLRQQHIRRYEQRLASGHPAVNVAQTQVLLDTWRGMAGKSWLVLSEPEEGEVVDALVDEGWDFQCDGDGEVLFAREPERAAGDGR